MAKSSVNNNQWQVLQSVAVPLLIVDKKESILFANRAAIAQHPRLHDSDSLTAILHLHPPNERAAEQLRQTLSAFFRQQQPIQVHISGLDYHFAPATAVTPEPAALITILPAASKADHLNLPLRVFDESQAVCLLIDPDNGRLIQANQAACNYYKYDADTLRDMTLFDLSALPAADVRQQMAEAGRQEKQIFRSCHRLADTYTQNVIVYISPLTLAGRELLHTVVIDVNFTKTFDTALRQSELRYRQLFEHMPAGLFRATAAGNFVNVNPAAVAMLNYPDRVTLMATPVSDLFMHDGDWDNMLLTLTPDNEIHTFETQLCRHDGRSIWGRIDLRLFFDDQHQQPFIQGYLEDISARKALESQLRQTEANLLAVFNASDIGFTLVAPDYQIVLVNETAQQHSTIVMGYTPQAGKDIRTSVRPADQDSFQAHFEAVLRQESIELTMPLKRADGSPLWLTFKYLPVIAEDGETLGVCLTSEDITAYKEAEAALIENETRFRQMANNIDQVFWLLDHKDQTLLYVSPAAETLFQLSDNELHGNIQSILEKAHPDDQVTLNKAIDEIMALSPSEEVIFDSRIVLNSGETRYVHSRFFPVLNQDGQVYRVAGITQDVTSRRQAEAQGLALTLEQERVQLLTSFVSNASHEFRTPLTVIEMALYMIEHVNDSTQRRRKIEEIRSQGQRMTLLVDSLLTMTRLDARRTIKMEQVSVNRVVKQALRSLQDNFHQKDLIVTFNLDPSRPQVQGEATLLRTAIASLLHNAIRYTAVNGTIHMTTKATDTAVAISIQDSGIGITHQALPHIFERFYRVDEAHTTMGFGLGLPIARRIVTLHTGAIDVTSTPEEGSCFTITLPIDKLAAGPINATQLGA